MLDFFTACVGLFSNTFDAACQLDFFLFLASLLVLDISVAFFVLLSRGTRKL